MPSYHVLWEIDVEADTPREAAEKALRIQRDPNSIAEVFSVQLQEIGQSHRHTLVEVDLTPAERL